MEERKRELCEYEYSVIDGRQASIEHPPGDHDIPSVSSILYQVFTVSEIVQGRFCVVQSRRVDQLSVMATPDVHVHEDAQCKTSATLFC